MRAVVTTKYGPPSVLKEIEIEIPKVNENEILIKIHYSTVSAGDCELRRMDFPFYFKIPLRLYFGILKPRKMILGQEIAGIVEEIGSDVKNFKVGDRVFGTPGLKMGGYAEYVTINVKSGDSGVAKIPDEVSFQEAVSLVVGGCNALHYISKVELDSSKTVLINGAGGSIGTIAIQLAKQKGCKVIAIDSEIKREMLLSTGADEFIDYTKTDFQKLDQSYDVIFDVVGSCSYSKALKRLNEKGVLLLGNPKLSQVIRSKFTNRRSSKKVFSDLAGYPEGDLNYLVKQVKNGEINPVIDKTYKLEEIIEAHKYVENKLKLGNLMLKIE